MLELISAFAQATPPWVSNLILAALLFLWAYVSVWFLTWAWNVMQDARDRKTLDEKLGGLERRTEKRIRQMKNYDS